MHVLLCGLLLAAALPVAVGAQEDASMLERRVKTAFLYKFADYVDWPAGLFTSQDTALVVGVLGDDQVASELAQVVARRPAESRPMVVRRLREGDATAGLHLLFIGRAENGRLPQLVRATSGQPVLLVTEAEGALNQGSIINFAVADGKVRFEIAVNNAEKRGLKLSSRLLTVAQNVRTGS